MTPEQYAQYQQYLAMQQAQAAPPPAPIYQAPVAATRPPVATRASIIAQVIATPKGNKSGEYFSDDDGRYDGDYVVDIVECKLPDVEQGQAFIADVKVFETSCPVLPPGSIRSLFFGLYRREGKADAQDFWSMLAEHQHVDLTNEVVDGWIGEAQTARDIRLHLSVKTKPQKKDKTKTFTHIRWRVLGRASEGHSMGLPYRSTAATPVAPPMPPFGVPPVAPPMPPFGVPPMPPQPGVPPVAPPMPPAAPYFNIPQAPEAPAMPPKPPNWDATGLPWPPPGLGMPQ